MPDLQDWNPDQAGEEMAALFQQANAILSKPIYQVQGSASTDQSDDAAPAQTTDVRANRKDTELIMTFTTSAKPLSYYASHSALGIASALEVEFGSHLQGLSLEDARLFRAALANLLANRTILCSAVPSHLQGYFRAIEDIDTAGIESLLLAVTQQIYSNNWN